MLPAFDPMLIFTGLMVLTVAAAVGALALALLKRDKKDERLKAVTERRRAMALQSAEQMRGQKRQQPKKKKSGVEELAEKLRLLQADKLRELKRQMQSAGWRDPSAPAKYIAATAGLPVVFLLLALVWTAGPLSEKGFMLKMAVMFGGPAFGFFLPRILLKNAAAKRRQSIQRAFPDGLDLMVICVEAGLSADAAFNRVTEEMIDGSPDLAEEFGTVAAELAFLPDRRTAYENLAERTGMPSMKSLATTLLQSEKYGTPVAVGLRVLAQENRESRMAAAEKKAAALPAQLTVPMIIFFLPALFAVIAGPAGLRISGN